MMLATGTTLGPYEIVGAIGAGGMGEVYRARDTKLGREVALKVLPEAFAADAERMARFEREAKLLASLNHPNIASIYGFEDSAGVHALVMELVEGPTLAERISGVVGAGLKPAPPTAKAIPLHEALPIAKQICEGLEYAHERGIIHRDLKPANVKITPEGVVKILDFGLAKTLEDDSVSRDISTSPTISRMATQAGIILGTAAYMSPEQAKGRPVDRRADIWAFGCVLFEMLAGKPAFAGETVSDVLAAVIRAEPDWTLLPATTPPAVRNLLRRCLQKDFRQRLQAIGDARIAMEEFLTGAPEPQAALIPAPARSRWARRLTWAVVALLAAATAMMVAYRHPAPPPAQPVVAQVDPPPNTVFAVAGVNGERPALSPDGQRLAFVAVGSDGVHRLWVRPLDSLVAQPLAGTDGAYYPFWSPDGRSLGFFAKGKLNRIASSGGAVLTIADAPSGRGASWGPDNTIVFSPTHNSPLFRVPASGGAPLPLTQLSQSRKDFAHRWPQFLPDGKHFLFYIWSANFQNSAIYAGSLDGGEPKLVLRNPSSALYASPGYLLFVRQDTLMAMRFDLSSLQPSGEMIPVGANIASGISLFLGLFTAAENGILAYVPKSDVTATFRLLWFDRSGKQIGETGTPAHYEGGRLSPDGNKLASHVGEADTLGSIWVFDLLHGTKTRLNFSNSLNVAPSWSADGKTISFVSNRSGTNPQLYRKPANGAGITTPLFADKELEENVRGAEWTPDGRYLVFVRPATQNGHHLEAWAMPLFGDGKPFPVLQDADFAGGGAVSPDGKWMAYVRNNSGQPEVDVAPFPRGSGRWQVSTSGGFAPRWRRDGKELFYLSPDNEIMAAEVASQGASFTVVKVQPLFRANSAGFDVSPDGKKFVMPVSQEQKTAQPVTLIVNWPALLKKQP